MGVCCIVFDIDGMLFEFFMNFLNIEKNKILRIIFFKISFSSRFMLFPTLKKKIWCKKKIRGGGGGVEFFFRKTILSHFTFYAIFNIKKIILKSAPNSRWGQLEFYIQYILYSLVLIVLSPAAPNYLPRRRRPGTGDIATPPVRLSVCLSVRHI